MENNFIKVRAIQCNAQGGTSQRVQPVIIDVNIDLVGGVINNNVFSKSEPLKIGNNYYTNLVKI